MVEDNGGGGGGGGLTPLIGTTPIPTTASSLAWECHDGSKVVVLAFVIGFDDDDTNNKFRNNTSSISNRF